MDLIVSLGRASSEIINNSLEQSPMRIFLLWNPPVMKVCHKCYELTFTSACKQGFNSEVDPTQNYLYRCEISSGQSVHCVHVLFWTECPLCPHSSNIMLEELPLLKWELQHCHHRMLIINHATDYWLSATVENPFVLTIRKIAQAPPVHNGMQYPMFSIQQTVVQQALAPQKRFQEST